MTGPFKKSRLNTFYSRTVWNKSYTLQNLYMQQEFIWSLPSSIPILEWDLVHVAASQPVHHLADRLHTVCYSPWVRFNFIDECFSVGKVHLSPFPSILSKSDLLLRLREQQENLPMTLRALIKFALLSIAQTLKSPGPSIMLPPLPFVWHTMGILWHAKAVMTSFTQWIPTDLHHNKAKHPWLKFCPLHDSSVPWKLSLRLDVN